MSVIHSGTFIRDPEWPAQNFAPAPSITPSPVDLGEILAKFEGWAGLTPAKQTKLIRDAGIAVARGAGLSHRQIARAAGVRHSRVQQIVGGFGA